MTVVVHNHLRARLLHHLRDGAADQRAIQRRSLPAEHDQLRVQLAHRIHDLTGHVRPGAHDRHQTQLRIRTRGEQQAECIRRRLAHAPPALPRRDVQWAEVRRRPLRCQRGRQRQQSGAGVREPDRHDDGVAARLPRDARFQRRAGSSAGHHVALRAVSCPA